MPHYCFYCPPGQEVAGCVERVCCLTPFIRPVQNQQGQRFNAPDAQKTWQWLMQWMQQRGYPTPPGVTFQCTITNGMMDQSQGVPDVYCIQQSQPAAGRAQIDAPYAQPVGNRGGQAPPPMVGPQQPPRAPGQAGMYDILPDAALPGNSDPMLGEIDGAGGTYMDIDAQGNEIPRQLQQLSGPTVHQRVAANQPR